MGTTIHYAAWDCPTREAANQISAMASEAHRGVLNLSREIYYQALQRYYEDKYIGYRKAMLFDGFLDQGAIAKLTGGAVVRENALCLDGAGAQGSMTTHRLGIGVGVTWNTARLWVRFNGGGIKAFIDGTAMEHTGRYHSVRVGTEDCVEDEFTLKSAGGSSVSVQLDLDCGDSAAMRVFDYGVIFL